ncbi:HNH endonuclease [Algibacter pectinivorans]|uniref:HNH endonuclease n=1 Tax=Algibacter pectinivorans TaxID=870482 RepID=A0A1I1SEW4_9FLAO|nr:HNH endonuclease [Algibacter pectinivorans]SFD42383.1 HNH endonuclease [Algibacter pectinivorans]
MILKADIPEIREWTESLWGKNSPYLNFNRLVDSPPILKKEERIETRMPNKVLKDKLIERDGHNCAFCGIPVIRAEIRKVIKGVYPNALKWERQNINQHSAFQAMWLQYDHLLPHSRGGNNDLDNLVITCAPCNFGRMQFTLEEVSLLNPLKRERRKTEWDGLERIKKTVVLHRI